MYLQIHAEAALAPILALLTGVDIRRPPFWLAYSPSKLEKERGPALHLLPRPERTSEWESWFWGYWQRGYRIAYPIVRNHADACDAVSTAFLRIERIPEEPRQFDHYFYQAVRTRAYDILRKRAIRRNETPLDERAFWKPDDNKTPEEITIENERAMLVRSAVASLPPVHRTIVVLYYFEDQTVPQIARTTGLTVYTVQNRLVEARAMLRQKLAPTVGHDFGLRSYQEA